MTPKEKAKERAWADLRPDLKRDVLTVLARENPVMEALSLTGDGSKLMAIGTTALDVLDKVPEGQVEELCTIMLRAAEIFTSIEDGLRGD